VSEKNRYFGADIMQTWRWTDLLQMLTGHHWQLYSEKVKRGQRYQIWDRQRPPVYTSHNPTIFICENSLNSGDAHP